jgi:hypothetical protein
MLYADNLSHLHRFFISKEFSFYAKLNLPRLGDKGYELNKNQMLKIPVPPVTDQSLDRYYNFTKEEIDFIDKFKV